MTTRQKITPCLWFEGNAEEAVRFYMSVFPGSSVQKTHRALTDTPGNKEGDVLFIEFTLAGQSYQALNGGPHDKFNDAISLSVDCADQAEVDRYWAALTGDGGKPVACGWLKDRFGVSWQIVPRRMLELLADPDPARGKRAMEAMMKMVKLDVAALEAAAAGKA
ncbi:MAG TPA: VOC family protein [Beijerinckiaceae bacterium]|jgi:predicted 3-demethylubiquinone-9 3-methyltransferase (glyoxalase superfamily)